MQEQYCELFKEYNGKIWRFSIALLSGTEPQPVGTVLYMGKHMADAIHG